MKWSDGASSRVPVTWNKVPSSQYAHTGSFTVNVKLTDGRGVHATVKVVPRTLTVKFDTRGGTAVSSQKVQEGKKASKPKDPVLYGYNFVGWYTAKSGGSKYDFNKAVWANTTLYAHWKVNPNSPRGACIVSTTPTAASISIRRTRPSGTISRGSAGASKAWLGTRPVADARLAGGESGVRQVTADGAR